MYISVNNNRTNSMAAYSTAFDPTGLAVGIAVGLFLLVLIIVCAYLWYRRLACFAGKLERFSPSLFLSDLFRFQQKNLPRRRQQWLVKPNLNLARNINQS